MARSFSSLAAAALCCALVLCASSTHAQETAATLPSPASPAPAAGAAAAASPAPAAGTAAAANPDFGAVPEACQTAGAELQGSCSAEFAAADEFFAANGVNTTAATTAATDGGAAAAPAPAPGITQELVDAYVKQAPRPAPDCCRVAKAFNDAKCSCVKTVLDLAVQFTGGNSGIYASIARGFADACGFPLLYGPTCPPARR